MEAATRRTQDTVKKSCVESAGSTSGGWETNHFGFCCLPFNHSDNCISEWVPSTNITATEKGWLYAEVADSLVFLPLAQAPFPWICGSEFTWNQQNWQKCFWRLWLWNPETPCKSTTVKVYILKGSQAWINPDQVPRLDLIYQPILLKLKPLDLRRHNLYVNS